jgi:hypothetical protein
LKRVAGTKRYINDNAYYQFRYEFEQARLTPACCFCASKKKRLDADKPYSGENELERRRWVNLGGGNDKNPVQMERFEKASGPMDKYNMRGKRG